MAGNGQQLDADAHKAMERKLEAELKTRVDEELRLRSQADELKVAKEAAAAAKARADEVAKELQAFKATADAAKARVDQETEAGKSLLLRDARLIAEARGVPAARVDEEAKRIAALGRPAVDELLRATPAPRADPVLLGLRGRDTPRADEAKDPIQLRIDEDEATGKVTPIWTVTDWSAIGKGVRA